MRINLRYPSLPVILIAIGIAITFVSFNVYRADIKKIKDEYKDSYDELDKQDLITKAKIRLMIGTIIGELWIFGVALHTIIK